MSQGLVVVLSPISLGRDGRTYNVNADHALWRSPRRYRFSAHFRQQRTGVSSMTPSYRRSDRKAEIWIESAKSTGYGPKVRSASKA